MDRVLQWVWDRHGTRYSWVVWAITNCLGLPVWLVWSLAVVAVEGSSRYMEAAVVTVVGLLVFSYILVLPGVGSNRLIEQWASGRELDRTKVLNATYVYARGAVGRAVGGAGTAAALVLGTVAAIAGATDWRLVHYAILGGLLGAASILIAVHSFAEAMLRPARTAIASGTDIGDALPRSRPSFAVWVATTVVVVAFAFAVSGAMVTSALDRLGEGPFIWGGVGLVLTTVIAVPITVVALFSPALLPIRDLAQGTERVAAGDYSQRLPVVQDDDLGALAASFNRMQAGLAERQRLQAAFGTYVDPILATRLLEQGDDVFAGERREVTVMFIDIRDFTPYAETNTAEDTVARLNALFEIVVPAVVATGGHVNKFLGDGALAVYGAPNDLVHHADAAMNSAMLIHRLVAERFGGTLRIGIGMNTGVVIAGTIGGGGKLEFTLIGDVVNVAARVEQLTKTTLDAILLTQQAVDALVDRPHGLIDRGLHVLKGKSAAVQVFGLDQGADAEVGLGSH